MLIPNEKELSEKGSITFFNFKEKIIEVAILINFIDFKN